MVSPTRPAANVKRYSSPIIDFGLVIAFSGQTGKALFTVLDSSRELGYSLAGIGDLNGDGVSEIVSGVPMLATDDIGEPTAVIVFNGKTGAALMTFTGPYGGVGSPQEFGKTVAAAGDVNGDGIPDFLYGSPHCSAPGVVVRSGATGGILYQFSGAGIGEAVRGFGDLNNDGVPDFGYTSAKSLIVRSGADGSQLWNLGIHSVGTGLAAVPDIDGDGISEILLGTPQEPFGPLAAGVVRLLSGATGTVLRGWSGATSGEGFGRSVASVGDLDGDGRADFAIGAPFAVGPDGPRGAVYLASSANANVLDKLDGEKAGDAFGWFVANVGDVNADGWDDLLVGAPTTKEQFSAPSRSAATIVTLAPGVVAFGSGKVGCFGAHFTNLVGLAKVGESNLRIRATAAPASGAGLALVGDALAPGGIDPFGLGIPLYVDPFASTNLLAITLLPVGEGISMGGLAIPNNPALAGTTVGIQTIFAWPSGPCAPSPLKLSDSPGIAVTIAP